MFYWLLTFNYSAGVVNEFITGVGKCTEQLSFLQIVTSIIFSRSATGVGKCYCATFIYTTCYFFTLQYRDSKCIVTATFIYTNCYFFTLQSVQG